MTLTASASAVKSTTVDSADVRRSGMDTGPDRHPRPLGIAVARGQEQVPRGERPRSRVVGAERQQVHPDHLVADQLVDERVAVD